MRTILLTHAARYPRMEPRDAVKLVYQNEFGGGHLIQDTQACLNFLQSEYASVPQDSDIPLLEDIGNGLVRVNLAALDHQGLSPAELGTAFLRSAQAHQGRMDVFQEKLDCLLSLTQEGRMPFSENNLEAYLKEYRQAGCPPVSHSETYRNAYHPAYRVVVLGCLFDE